MAKKKNNILKINFMYRDGANFKSYIPYEIDLKSYPDAKNLKVGDDIEMGNYGTLTFDEYFDNGDYDEEIDHNILEVVEILLNNENSHSSTII
jgi:hypothetical protein